jgi:hypothetical protein
MLIPAPTLLLVLERPAHEFDLRGSPSEPAAWVDALAERSGDVVREERL